MTNKLEHMFKLQYDLQEKLGTWDKISTDEDWQKLVNQHIEELRSQFQEETQKCETSLEEFFKNYNIVEEVAQEPVELQRAVIGILTILKSIAKSTS